VLVVTLALPFAYVGWILTSSTDSTPIADKPIDLEVKAIREVLTLRNTSAENLFTCKLTLDLEYWYKEISIPAGEMVRIATRDFTKHGSLRFNPSEIKARKLSIRCGSSSGMRSGVFELP
jgi:hypothetical protein